MSAFQFHQEHPSEVLETRAQAFPLKIYKDGRLWIAPIPLQAWIEDDKAYTKPEQGDFSIKPAIRIPLFHTQHPAPGRMTQLLLAPYRIVVTKPISLSYPEIIAHWRVDLPIQEISAAITGVAIGEPGYVAPEVPYHLYALQGGPHERYAVAMTEAVVVGNLGIDVLQYNQPRDAIRPVLSEVIQML